VAERLQFHGEKHLKSSARGQWLLFLYVFQEYILFLKNIKLIFNIFQECFWYVGIKNKKKQKQKILINF
jgi:hypothetical protein